MRKNIGNIGRILEVWLWRLASLLRTEHKFNCSITGLRKAREDVNDDARSDRSSTSTTDENIEAVKKMILDNHRIFIREIADDVGILFPSCQAIFTDI